MKNKNFMQAKVEGYLDYYGLPCPKEGSSYLQEPPRYVVARFLNPYRDPRDPSSRVVYTAWLEMADDNLPAIGDMVVVRESALYPYLDGDRLSPGEWAPLGKQIVDQQKAYADSTARRLAATCWDKQLF